MPPSAFVSVTKISTVGVVLRPASITSVPAKRQNAVTKVEMASPVGLESRPITIFFALVISKNAFT